MDDSTNLQPPFLGPQRPLYPELPQVNRVAQAALPGTNVYPAFTSQWAPPLTLRDREPSYVLEPNGVILAPGYYDCRLIGSYLGLPLYATTCCPQGGFSSASGGSPGASAAPAAASPSSSARAPSSSSSKPFQ